MKSSVLLSFAVVALCLVGCATPSPRCMFTVGNKSDVDVAAVRLEYDGAVKYSLDTLPARTAAEYRDMGAALPRESKLRWTSGGREYATDIKLDRPLTERFSGRVQFEINASNQIRVFVMPAAGPGDSSIPWASSGSFDGNVMMPMLNQ